MLAAAVAEAGLAWSRLPVPQPGLAGFRLLPVAAPTGRISAVVAARPGLPAPALRLVLTGLRALPLPVVLPAGVTGPGLAGPDRRQIGELALVRWRRGVALPLGQVCFVTCSAATGPTGE